MKDRTIVTLNYKELVDNNICVTVKDNSGNSVGHPIVIEHEYGE